MNHQQISLAKSTIMMIDDEQITMDIVQAYLEEDGYTNFVLESRPTAAMETLEKVNPDTLFLDLVMPEKSGFEILSEIRNHPKFKHLPVIILTSSTDPENKLKALELGATDLLEKPVDQSELRLRLRNTLGAKAYVDQLAYYNPVTNLPNKHLFQERLDWAFDNAKRHEEAFALLSIALDNLGGINAAMGQGTGDDVLREIASRIRQISRSSDFFSASTENEVSEEAVFHTEGNIFSLLLDRITRSQDAAKVATRIMDAFKSPIEISGSEIYITLSIGIATYPSEGSNSATLLRLSSSARDYVEKHGGNDFQFSSNAINGMYERKMCMESMLRKALEKDQFVLHYQPKVNVGTGQIQGVEALLRWNNGSDGIISPVDFIPLAEETGLIIPIGEWIIHEASRQLSEWRNRATLPLTMNVNLSAVQFNDDNLLPILNRAITENKIPAQYLTLEITETLLMHDVEQKIGIMRKIRDMGLKTISEGVETQPQLQFLKTIDCDEYQGFLFSRPLPAKSFYQVFLKQYERNSIINPGSNILRKSAVTSPQTQVIGIQKAVI